MLQLPVRTVAGIHHAPDRKDPVKSRVVDLINAFIAARREQRLAKVQYDELATKHPELCVDDPIIFLFTNGEGEPVHGDFRDIHRFFPSSNDGWSPASKRRREKLLEQYREARRLLAEQRKSVGLAASFSRLADASYRERQRLLAICRYRPMSVSDARRQARVVRKYLPEIAHAPGGFLTGERFKIYGTVYDANEYEGWCKARVDAFGFLAALARSLGNTGGR